MKTKTYVKGVAALCALAAVACTGVQQSRGDVAVYLDESQPRPVKELKGLKRYTSRPARAEPSRSKSTPGCSPVTTMRKGSGALNPVNSPLMSAPRRTTSAEPSISC